MGIPVCIIKLCAYGDKHIHLATGHCCCKEADCPTRGEQEARVHTRHRAVLAQPDSKLHGFALFVQAEADQDVMQLLLVN